MSTVTVSPKFQVVIPREIREAMNCLLYTSDAADE